MVKESLLWDFQKLNSLFCSESSVVKILPRKSGPQFFLFVKQRPKLDNSKVNTMAYNFTNYRESSFPYLEEENMGVFK